MSMNSTTVRILPVSMPPEDLRGSQSGPRAVVQVFEARADGQGEWRLDESPRGGWAARIKQVLLVALSLAVAATLWVFAFALMLVLLPLVAVAGWYLWRRLKSMQRAHMQHMQYTAQASRASREAQAQRSDDPH
jgi:hypothetical protein